ncbi:pre-mRNA-splicing factor CWC25 homolog [Pollicipes pollicipes]|uniref:pre-mRNA-splicing factor CWC25 homolog n=1 Tax=Pollicipes pollicipes TaxID=41117 RepID=UPI001884DDE6|nr:pre-mRNA-splicing factor CWC25 homolog [Pollicipes pollicipes]
MAESDKLNWMYEGNKSTLNREEYLLGKQIDSNFERQQDEEKAAGPVYKVEHEILPGSVARRDLGQMQVDLARKIQEDPLFQIRKQEDQALQELMDNPIKRKQLEKLRKAEAEGEDGNKKKKHKKQEEDIDKKLFAKMALLLQNGSESSDSDSDDHDSSSSSSGSESPAPAKKKKKPSRKRSRSRSSSAGDRRSGSEGACRARQTARPDGVPSRRHADSASRPEKDGGAGEKCGRGRDGRGGERHRLEEGSRGADRERAKQDSRGGHRDRGEQDNRGGHRDRGEQDNRGGHRDRAERGSRGGQRDRAERDSKGSRRDKTERDGRDGYRERTERSGRDEDRDRRGTNGSGGGRNQSEKVRGRGSVLSQEEMDRKRQEMMDNAKLRDQQRADNLARYDSEQAREQQEHEKGSGEASFVRDQLRAAADRGTVEQRIRSNRYNIQRSAAAMDRSFVKR